VEVSESISLTLFAKREFAPASYRFKLEFNGPVPFGGYRG